MAERPATSVEDRPPRLMRFMADRRSLAAAGGLLLVLLLPVWLWPDVATQDGPSHLYNAAVMNESLAGHGPSLDVYQVAWQPLPNWAGTFLLMALLKVLPQWLIPRVMLTVTSLAPVAAILWLRRELGGSRGLVWCVAVAATLATGRAWALGFESFCLGTAAAVGVLALYERNRERLGPLNSLAIAGLLAFTYFCHLVPWVFAAGTLGACLLAGAAPGGGRRLSRSGALWTGAILLSTVPFLFLYWRLSRAHAGGPALDWNHLKGFHLTGVRYWLMLWARADCVAVLGRFLPFTAIGPAPGEPAGAAAAQVASSVLGRIAFDPFLFLAAGALLQAIGTAVADFRARDNRRLAWFLLGLGGVLLALVMPDGTPQNGTFLPLRVMLLSLTLLVAYARLEGRRALNVATSLLIAAGFTLHAAAVWDYAQSASRQMRDVRTAAMHIPAGQRIYQIGTPHRSRFLIDPLLHADAYAALWSHGILLSNYEAAHYYFPVKLRPDYPQTLVALVSQLQELDPAREDDRIRVPQFLKEHAASIDVLLVQTRDERLVALARPTFEQLLWNSDGLWLLARRPPHQF